LLSELSGKKLEHAATQFILSYDASGDFHPEILLSIARYYERNHLPHHALQYYHRLADTPGFEEQSAKIEACTCLGEYYRQRQNFELARECLWKAIIYTRQTGGDTNSLANAIYNFFPDQAGNRHASAK